MKYFALAIASMAISLSAVAEDPTQIGLEELRAKYAGGSSRFVTIDGAEIHYRDEGQGPVVILLHASYFNLLAWDELTEALVNDYRVIRFDFPNVGLSGPETKEPPGGKFNLIERNVEILEGLVEEFDLEPFALVATSSGGSVGFRYASRFPENVTRLVLINSAGMPRTARTDPNRARPETAQWDDMPVRPREFWEFSVNQNFPSDADAPDWFVDLAYDLNRRGETTPVEKYFFETGDPQSILSGIQAPTLILWGKANPTVMHLEGDVFQHWITSAPSFLKKYEGLGHYPYVEAPERVIPDVAAFLAGSWDDRLRQTQRVKVTP
ncbi:MAG: alpha/beta hydrolase [Gammaproteobacteria bacterium]|nr:alpha/beta hydrolase [Gammaproteobacteria bacterium]